MRVLSPCIHITFIPYIPFLYQDLCSYIKIYVPFSALLFSLLFLYQSRQSPFITFLSLWYILPSYTFLSLPFYSIFTLSFYYNYGTSYIIFSFDSYLPYPIIYQVTILFRISFSLSQYLPLVYFPEAGLLLVVTIAEHDSQVAPKRILRLSIHLLQIFIVKCEYMRSS